MPKLFLLTRLDDPGYDEYDAKIIIASNHQEARMMANINTADEGKIWANADKVLCQEVSLDQPSIVWEDFKAG